MIGVLICPAGIHQAGKLTRGRHLVYAVTEKPKQTLPVASREQWEKRIKRASLISADGHTVSCIKMGNVISPDVSANCLTNCRWGLCPVVPQWALFFFLANYFISCFERSSMQRLLFSVLWALECCYLFCSFLKPFYCKVMHIFNHLLNMP